jgi:uncharacterized membrane protein YgcG
MTAPTSRDRHAPTPPRSSWRRHVAAIGLAAPTLAVPLLAVVLLAAPTAAHADEEDFTFESFHADMILSRDDDGHAELAVTETLVARFPQDEEQNRGIIRAIPDDYDGVPLHTEVLSVTDAQGDAVPFELSEDDGFLEVATGDDSFVFGSQTYVISYTQRDTIRAFDDTDADEFQRDINGTGWEQPFARVSTSLTLEPDLVAELTGNAACYRGEEGSRDTCDIERVEENGSAVFRASTPNLESEEGLTIVVGFERGTFVPGEVERNAVEQFAFDATPAVQAGSIAAIVLSVAAAIAALLGRRQSRDARGRGVIVPEYEAPSGLTVMQAAHLAGRPTHAVPAALVDLAVAGNVRILAAEGADTADGVTLEFVRTSDDAERSDLLVALFGEGADVGARKIIAADAQALAKRLSDLSDVAKESLRAAGLTEQPRQSILTLAIYGAIAAFVLALVCLVLGALGRTGTWVGIAALIAAVVAGVLGVALWRYRDRVTEAGAPVRDRLLGLRDYLALAETDRLRVLQSPAGAERIDVDDALQVVHLYEELLPYAVIWGVEKDWAEVLELRVREAGTSLAWYGGGTSFSSVHFVTTFAALRTGSSPSAWTGSGGGSMTGGSMGGGFSGMGSGGGGGGGR